MNQAPAVLRAAGAFLCPWSSAGTGWGWAQLPHWGSVICFFHSQFSRSTWWGQRGQDSHNLSLWFHPLHSQERFRNRL